MLVTLYADDGKQAAIWNKLLQILHAHQPPRPPEGPLVEIPQLAKSDPDSLTAPVSHQKRPQQNATNAIDLKRKCGKINEPVR
jgi:hypothetical protein